MTLSTRLAALAAISLGGSACQDLPRDDGQIWSCFGLVTETAAGATVPSNLYFGGCTPADPGMQVVTFARPEASTDEIINACDTSCEAAFAHYWQGHSDVALPLQCQTFFASPCLDPPLGADTTALGNADVGFFSGGPADYRTALNGSLTVSFADGTAQVPGTGVIDTAFPACASGQTCTVDVSRFDSVASGSFAFGSSNVDLAQVQMQGLETATKIASQFTLAAQSVEVEANFTVDGERASLHADNPQDIVFTSPQPGELSVDGTFGAAPNTVHVQMSGTAEGSPPIAAITPSSGSFECTCNTCTPVDFDSTTTDPDGDVTNLSWLADDQVVASGDEHVSLQLGVGAHRVKLVATDTRGAATSATAAISVVDTTPPVITAPPDVSFRTCDFPQIGAATASDTCSQTFISNNDPGSFNVGTTTITWTAQDEAGNRATATQRVTVVQAADSTCCPPGYNLIIGTGSGARITGTSGNDCIIGTDGNDTIDGGDGDDYIIARGGQDVITGGPGNDVILAGDGDDAIDGGDGDDLISSGPGQTSMLITGGAGNDIIRGGTGDDRVQAGDGNDTIIGGDGQDTLDGQAGNDVIAGGNGDNHLIGEDGDDLLTGGPTRDTIEAGNGNDVLVGGDGDDALSGGTGTDLFVGGAGHNQCTGGGTGSRFLQCQ